MVGVVHAMVAIESAVVALAANLAGRILTRRWSIARERVSSR